MRTIKYETPYDWDEVYSLQRETTKLLRVHEAALSERRDKANNGRDGENVESDHAQQHSARALAPSTILEYRKRARGLLSKMQLHEQCGGELTNIWLMVDDIAKNNASANTAKAALQYFLVEAIREAKRGLDQCDRDRKLEAAPDFEVAKQWGRTLANYSNILADMPELAGAEQTTSTHGSTKNRRATKGASLRGLQHDWRERVAEKIRPAIKLAWLTQCVTGCRPVELTTGVTLCLSEDGASISTRVTGAKVTGYAGQPERRLIIATRAGPAKMLAEMLIPGKEITVAVAGRVQNYEKTVSRVCRKLWPLRVAVETKPSAYSARHQFKADLVAGGFSATKIAEAMGHATTKSARYYGGSGKRSGAVEPLHISATRAVKIKAGYMAKLEVDGTAHAIVEKSPTPQVVRRRTMKR